MAGLKVVVSAHVNWLLPCRNVVPVLQSLEMFVFKLGICIFIWSDCFCCVKNTQNCDLKLHYLAHHVAGWQFELGMGGLPQMSEINCWLARHLCSWGLSGCWVYVYLCVTCVSHPAA